MEIGAVDDGPESELVVLLRQLTPGESAYLKEQVEQMIARRTAGSARGVIATKTLEDVGRYLYMQQAKTRCWSPRRPAEDEEKSRDRKTKIITSHIGCWTLKTMLLAACLLGLTIVSLVGCATREQRLARHAEILQSKDTDTLCKITVTEPNRKQLAETELGRRSATCDWQKVQMMIQSEQNEALLKQQRMQAVAAALSKVQPVQPIQPYQMPTRQQTNCTTSYIGNQAHTTCY